MTTPQPDSVRLIPPRLIPLAEIDPQALPRDRLAVDDRPLEELINSIAAHGLRMPVELWELSHPRPPHRYGLTIRRERTRDGWCLHFTGREAKGGLMDDIMDEVEWLFGTR